MRKKRTVQKTDIDQFNKEVLSKGPLAALPKNLPDRWLKAFARDMALDDKAEAKGEKVGDEALPVAALLGVLILLSHKKGGDPETIEFSQSEIAQEYHAYKSAIYSEIIGRQIGVFIDSYELASIGTN